MLWTKESRVGDRHLRVISEWYTLLNGGENMPTWITLKKNQRVSVFNKEDGGGFFFFTFINNRKEMIKK